MKSILNIVILTIFFNSYCIGQSISKIDSIIFYKSGGYHFTWGAEDVSEQIYIAKDTNLFVHYFRQHLLVDIYYGIFKITNDTLYLECIHNCELYGRRGLNLGPIILPINDGRYKDTLLISRADGSTDSITGKITRNTANKVDTIIITDKNKVFKEIIKEPAEYYIIKIDYDFKIYDNNKNKLKIGTIHGDKLILDNKQYNRNEYSPTKTEEFKKGNKKKNKNKTASG